MIKMRGPSWGRELWLLAESLLDGLPCAVQRLCDL
jgi:hypothetical protein